MCDWLYKKYFSFTTKKKQGRNFEKSIGVFCVRKYIRVEGTSERNFDEFLVISPLRYI